MWLIFGMARVIISRISKKVEESQLLLDGVGLKPELVTSHECPDGG